MRVTIHQPNYLPYSAFFNKIKRTEMLIIFDKSKFTKNDFQQRNRIKTPQGERYLIIPVSKEFNNATLNEVKFLNNRFKKRHPDTIHQYYHKAPYYDSYKDDFRKLYKNSTDKLSDFNIAIIKYLIKALGLETEIKLSTELKVDFSLLGTDINLALLEDVNASYYLSGVGGKDYIEVKKFKERGIDVEFQDFKFMEYPQLYGDFIPRLSVIDLLFNTGEKAIKYL